MTSNIVTNFIKAICTKKKPTRLYTAVFTDGTTAEYAAGVLEPLLTDPNVECVFDSYTGEILER